MNLHCRSKLINILIAFMILSGCSSISKIGDKTKKLTKKIIFSGNGLKKKIGISEVRENSLFQKTLTENIGQICPDLLQKPLSLPENSDTMSIVRIGRENGLNAVVRGRVGTVSVDREEKGFPMFKKLRYEVSISASIELYDMNTAAKLFDGSLSRNVEIGESDAELIKSGRQNIASAVSNDALAEMAAEFAGNICDIVSKQNWRGYVVSVDKNIVRLSAGKDTGLQPGALLEVYDPGEPVKGAEGQQFFKYGIKVAEIKVISVSDHYSEAIVFSGRDIREGCWVKEK